MSKYLGLQDTPGLLPDRVVQDRHLITNMTTIPLENGDSIVVANQSALESHINKQVARRDDVWRDRIHIQQLIYDLHDHIRETLVMPYRFDYPDALAKALTGAIQRISGVWVDIYYQTKQYPDIRAVLDEWGYGPYVDTLLGAIDAALKGDGGLQLLKLSSPETREMIQLINEEFEGTRKPGRPMEDKVKLAAPHIERYHASGLSWREAVERYREYLLDKKRAGKRLSRAENEALGEIAAWDDLGRDLGRLGRRWCKQYNRKSG